MQIIFRSFSFTTRHRISYNNNNDDKGGGRDGCASGACQRWEVYYGYGYKPLASYDNWRRLNGILADYLDWAEEPGAVRFASADSEQMEENPFHCVYRFCKYKPGAYPATFLHTLALLSGEFSLRALPAAVQEDEERQMHLEDVLAAGGPFKTADLLALIGA